MDTVSQQVRSRNMARIRSKDTGPEIRVRRLAHRMGFRFRIHREDLPGKPDLVFPGRGRVIFVHGCFWHRHTGCAECSVPKSRTEYWAPKFARTIGRDKSAIRKLRRKGWRVAVIWECQTEDLLVLEKRLERLLACSDGGAHGR